MNLKKVTQLQRAFVKARDWEQFHTPKNLAVALSVEASELLEVFQWMKDKESLKPEAAAHVREEIADVFFYLVRLSDVLEIDLEQAFMDKMKKNARKYPVRLSKGSSRKYTELRKKNSRKS
jgi:NTP pyrophosphatase (non-canonical NTP hydrolase)